MKKNIHLAKSISFRFDALVGNSYRYQYLENFNGDIMGISSKNRPKKMGRAKTFTGCWTCRRRKVKCDLRHPHCQRCEKSNLPCGGYDIKLRWSKPMQFDPYGVPIPQNSPATTTNLSGVSIYHNTNDGTSILCAMMKNTCIMKIWMMS